MAFSENVLNLAAEEVPVPPTLYERAERCVNRLGYEWAALQWEESQVEVRALGALKSAVLEREGEDDVKRAINLVRSAFGDCMLCGFQRFQGLACPNHWTVSVPAINGVTRLKFSTRGAAVFSVRMTSQF